MLGMELLFKEHKLKALPKGLPTSVKILPFLKKQEILPIFQENKKKEMAESKEANKKSCTEARSLFDYFQRREILFPCNFLYNFLHNFGCLLVLLVRLQIFGISSSTSNICTSRSPNSYFGGGFVFQGIIGTLAPTLPNSIGGFGLGYMGMGAARWPNSYIGKGFVPNCGGPIGHSIRYGATETDILYNQLSPFWDSMVYKGGSIVEFDTCDGTTGKHKALIFI